MSQATRCSSLLILLLVPRALALDQREREEKARDEAEGREMEESEGMAFRTHKQSAYFSFFTRLPHRECVSKEAIHHYDGTQ